MKKYFFGAVLAVLVSGCSWQSPEYVEPEYNYIADHVVVIEKSPWHVIYEYSDIRVDEIAPVAAIYCANRGGLQASLYNVELRPDHRRRATFTCGKVSEY